MTLRRRLTLAFAILVGLFALNLVVHLLSDHRRHESLDRLHQAIERQLLVVRLQQQVDDRALEAHLVSSDHAEGEGLSDEERQVLEAKLAELDDDVDRLLSLTPGSRRSQVGVLHQAVANLRAAWRRAYGDGSYAAADRAQRLVDEELAGLAIEERLAVDSASDEVLQLAHATSRWAGVFFLLSTLVALIVALRVSRHLDERLGLLREGAARVGRGELGTPIPVPERDELGLLAETFNDMAARLAALQQAESLLRQEEKMASLGKVAAGLAHELNNPAAAVRRNLSSLEDHLAELARLAGEIVARGVPAGTLAALDAHRRDAITSAGGAPLDPLERGDREAAMEDLLDRLGADEPWELAPDLVRAGVSVEALERLAAGLPEAGRPVALAWWARVVAADALLAESSLAATRLSDIVGAVGRYSHLGEAPVGDVDLVAGLEDTLTVLRSRLGRVRVERDFSPGLPAVEGHAGELNQVWTILIDNALDAMAGTGDDGGTLCLSARRLGDGRVAVAVADSGPGIPEAVQRSIFDPFFTTKAVGSGTGLGLHIARQIVDQHGGEIEVDSDGSGTRFRVLLPLSRGEDPGES